MLLREPPAQREMARLAELYMETQLIKRGAAFVSYPRPAEQQTRASLSRNDRNS